MSYFNIFFEETFKESDDSSVIVEQDEETAKEVYKIIGSEETANVDLPIFDEKEYDSSQLVNTEVYLASNRKDEFFKVIESNTTSRSSVPRKMSIDAASVNKNINIVLYHTHGTESYLPYKDYN